MTKHLVRDLDDLHRSIMSLSAVVEDMIDKSSRAMTERRLDLAMEVIDTDEVVDQSEVRIEEECLKIIALHQPVAVDLRRIATVMKVNNDLERIADLAVNVAERTRALEEHPNFPIPDDLARMASQAAMMVRTALDSFVDCNVEKARQVLQTDDFVDQLNVEIIRHLKEVMQADSQSVEPALHCFSASRHLERIADHATNIAEDVIYLADGEIVRHQHERDKLAESDSF